MDELSPINIDLTAAQRGILNESYYGQFATATKMLMQFLFPYELSKLKKTMKDLKEEEGEKPLPPDLNVDIKGSPAQVDAFASALRLEKDYMKTYIDHGLNNEKTLAAKHELNDAVEKFEDETKIKWPFK